MSTTFNIPVDDGCYLIKAGDCDIEEALNETELSDGFALDPHRDVVFVGTFDDESTAVEVRVEILDAPPVPRYRELESTFDAVRQTQFYASDTLLLTTLEQATIAELEIGPGNLALTLCGRRARSGQPEQHLLLIYPDRTHDFAS